MTVITFTSKAGDKEFKFWSFFAEALQQELDAVVTHVENGQFTVKVADNEVQKVVNHARNLNFIYAGEQRIN